MGWSIEAEHPPVGDVRVYVRTITHAGRSLYCQTAVGMTWRLAVRLAGLASNLKAPEVGNTVCGDCLPLAPYKVQ